MAAPDRPVEAQLTPITRMAEAYRMRWKRRRLLYRAWRKRGEIAPVEWAGLCDHLDHRPGHLQVCTESYVIRRPILTPFVLEPHARAGRHARGWMPQEAEGHKSLERRSLP